MSEQIHKPQCSACGTFDGELRLVKYDSEEGTMYLEGCHNCTVNPDEDHQWEDFEYSKIADREKWWNESPLSTQEEIDKISS